MRLQENAINLLNNNVFEEHLSFVVVVVVVLAAPEISEPKPGREPGQPSYVTCKM